MSVKRRTSLYTPSRASGSDRLQQWKAALAGQARAQRGKRGRRGKRTVTAYKPGMNRRQDRPAAGEPAA